MTGEVSNECVIISLSAPSPLRGEGVRGSTLSRRLLDRWPQPEQVTDRVNEIGAVHGVEVKVGDAAVDQIEYLFGRNGRCDQLPRGGVFIQSGETLRQPNRHGSPTALGEICGLLEILHRQNAGHDRDLNPACAYAVEVTKVEIVVEEELRYRTSRARIHLLFQHIDVSFHRRAVGMLLRIG